MKVIKEIGCWIVVAAFQFLAQGVPVVGTVDTRTSSNARVVSSVVCLGTPTGEVGPSWNSATVPDGWQTVSSGLSSTNLLVLNGCAVRGGRMTGNATWDADKMTVLRNSVFVPNGMSLTIGSGATVKCTPETVIDVEAGATLVLKGATITDIADDSVGGDTNHDGTDTVMTRMPESFIVGAGIPSIFRVTLWNGGTREGPVRWYSAEQVYGTLPVLAREGFKFDGWFTSVEGGIPVTSSSSVSHESLYAHWTAYVIGLDASEVQISANADTYSFGVSANGSWEVAVGDAPWIVLNTHSGSGNGMVSYSVLSNGEMGERSATITVTCAGMVREFTVCQAGCEGVATPKITPSNGTAFSGVSRRCAISCATAGATIHYTLNGKEPDESDPVYAGVSFNVFDSTTIKARAYKVGLAASAVAVSRVVRAKSIADALDVPLWSVSNDQDAPWTVDENEAYGTKASARSGVILGAKSAWHLW